MEKTKLVVGIITSRIVNLDAKYINKLSKVLSAKMPGHEFSYKFQSGQWDGTMKFMIRPANKFPTGLVQRVIKFLHKNNIEFEVVNEMTSNIDNIEEIPIGYKLCKEKELRNYQVESVNNTINNTLDGTLLFPRGIINLATNAGKTTVAETIMRLMIPQLKKKKMNLLFVTHSKEIAFQAKKSIEKDLRIKCGFIGDGNWDVRTITIALIPTLYSRLKKNNKEFKELVKTTLGFIADEVHHSSSTSWYDVLNKFVNAPLRIGLTGTVDTKNPVNNMRLHACTGNILMKVTNEFLIENGFSARPICIMFYVSEPDLDGIYYQDAYSSCIVENEERNGLIYEIANKETCNNNKVLVLVERLEHGNIIQNKLKKLNNKVVHFTHGKLSGDERQFLLEQLKVGKIDVLISSSILDEGVDVSGINAIIYARGMKSSRKLLQGIGRGLRKKEDNSCLRFYDFIDDTHMKLLEHSLERNDTLENEGFTVKLVKIEDYRKCKLSDLEKDDKDE